MKNYIKMGMKTCFHSHYNAYFHASVNFGIFDRIFMKFSAKCRTKNLGMIFTILGSFCSFLNWEGAVIRPKIRPRKISVKFTILLSIETLLHAEF